MKKIVFILSILVLSIGFIIAQDVKKAPKAEFKKEAHDFGKVAESSNSISHEFIFKNIGTAPLIIQRVPTSCGCTTPEYPNEPILPGKEGKIKITYSTVGRIGTFVKEFPVFTNVADTVYRISIKGEVLRK